MAMRIYVIGPVSGIAEDNRPAFEDAKRRLADAFGCRVEIPHENVAPGTPWEKAMRVSVARMMDATLVVALPGWSDSEGASIERRIADDVCITTLPLYEALSMGGAKVPDGSEPKRR